MSAYLKSLVDSRASIWERAKEIMDAAAAENRDLTAEEQTNLDAINSDLDAKDARIQQATALEERAKLADGVRERYAAILAAKPEAPKGDPTDRDILRAMFRGESRELNSQVNVESRALATSSSTVPTSFADFVVVYQRTLNPTYGLATVIRTANGEGITVPRLTADVATPSTLIAEAGTIPLADPTISSISLNAYKYGSITKWSSELGSDNAVNLEQLVATSTGRDLGLNVGTALTTGDGSSKPNGFMNAASNGGTASGTPFFTADDLISLFYGRAQPYRMSAGAAWQVSNSALQKIRKFKDDQGQYLWQPSLQAGQPDLVLGKPIFENPAMASVASASKSVAFGDFSAYLVREVVPMNVVLSSEFAFQTDEIAIRTTWRIDGDLPDVNAIAYLVSANS
jgi:HK97 family phage major capsid protein